MINPHLACHLKRAERIFRKMGQPILAQACHRERGNLADSIIPHELEAYRLINMAENTHANTRP
jgi:hypothetical protein